MIDRSDLHDAIQSAIEKVIEEVGEGDIGWNLVVEHVETAVIAWAAARPADAPPAPQDGPGGAGMGRAQTEPYLAPWSLGQTSRGGPTPVMDAEDRCIALFLTRQTAERAVRAVNASQNPEEERNGSD